MLRSLCSTLSQTCVCLVAAFPALPCPSAVWLGANHTTSGFFLFLLPQSADRRVPLHPHVPPLRPADFRADLLESTRFFPADDASHLVRLLALRFDVSPSRNHRICVDALASVGVAVRLMLRPSRTAEQRQFRVAQSTVTCLPGAAEQTPA